MLLLSITVLLVCIARISCSCGSCTPHRPINGSHHLVRYDEFKGSDVYFAFPDKTSTDTVEQKFFLNPFNFNDSSEGTFLTGAKNTLYEFNATDLTVTKSYSWSPIEGDRLNCLNVAADPEVACENYIRLYKKLPYANDRLLVCGTGAYNVTCRTLDRMNINDTSLEGPPTVNLDIGIISVHPLVPFAGDFLDDPSLGYQTTGYTQVGNLNTFDFARYNTSYNISTREVEFVTQPSRTILTTNTFHIQPPYLPVKLIKQDFDGTDEYKMFYFFIRERKYYTQVSDAVPVRARIIRVCQQDNGVDIGANNLFFKTYIKMEMLCFGDPLNTPRAVGAQEHYYTVLRDIIQTDTPSRWNSNTNVWHKLVYGIFTGDVYGPNGTAICVYHAYFSSTTLLDNSNRGIVDVFNFNQFRDEQGAKESGALLSCNKANERSAEEFDHIIAVDPIRPYFGLSLPLLEIEGEIFTKILSQQVCVRLFNDSSSCLMQDVLFVGTNKGRVKKIVFSTIKDSVNAELNGVTHDAIVAQEWELADGNSVEQLTMMGDYLYIGTYTRIYKFPIANCDRHTNCGDCVGSRDPYCYWDTAGVGACTRNNIGTAGNEGSYAFSTNFLQNIHTGEDTQCGLLPNCTLTMESTASNTITVSGIDDCSDANSFTATIKPYDGCEAETITSPITASDSTIQNDAILGRRLYEVTVTAVGTNGDSSYSERVLTPDGVPIAPSNNEVSSRAINGSHVQVIVSLEGCNIHDELVEHRICVEFIDTLSNSVSFCQNYTGLNTFVSGPYKGSESINYTVTVKNSYGEAAMSTPLSVTTFAAPPNAPVDLVVVSVGINSISLEWKEGDQGFSEITGYSLFVNGQKRTDCSTLNTNYTLYGLYSYTDYSISVTACTAGGESDQTVINTSTMCDRPLPVRNLDVSDVDSNYITFEWEPPVFANGTEMTYMVVEQCYNFSTFFVDEEMSQNTSTQYTIMNVLPLIRCCIEVTVVSRCNGSIFQSEPSFLCNQTLDDVPGQVENLNVSSPNPEALFVTWSTPLNYTDPSLTYEVQWYTMGSSIDSSMVSDRLYHFIDGLTESTLYTITVTAFSPDVGSGAGKTVSFETIPSVPTPPDNVNITFEGCLMTVRWTYNDGDKLDVEMYLYNVRARCNRNVYEANMTNAMSHTFDVCEGGSIINLAWCTAQVQAVNMVGGSEYSNIAERVTNQSQPSIPMCYVTQNISGMVAISYTITTPYALDRLTVNYTLTPELPNNPPNKTFNVDNDNVLVLSGLNRTRVYQFQLMLCDMDNGCSDSCELSITPSQVAPDPPTDINTSDITDRQIVLSWSPPENEDNQTLMYIVFVTGNGVSFNITTTDNTVTITDSLFPDYYYYITTRSVDMGANLIGRYSDSLEVRMMSGPPAEPNITNVEFVTQDNNSALSVFWSLAFPFNGTVTFFEISWVAEVRYRSCQESYTMNITDLSARFINISNPRGLTDNPDAGSVCIRSGNADNLSEWFIYNFTTTIVRVTSQQISIVEPQSIGLLSGVVFLAIVAIVVSIILVICLYFVSRNYRSSINRKDDTPVDSENVTTEMADGIFDDDGTGRTPPKRYESTRSTTSRTVIIPKNRNRGDSEEGCCKVA